MKDRLIKSITSVVVPIHNEEGCLRHQLEVFIDTWKRLNLGEFEIIVVENGSSDHSWEEVQALGQQYVQVKAFHLENASYGQALKAGLQKAQGEKIVCIDVDYYDFDFISTALPQLGSGYMAVVGSKLHIESKDSRTFDRRLMTRVLSRVFQGLFHYSGTDTHGLKCFQNTNLLHDCIYRCVCKNELFDSELLLRLTTEEIKFIEIPVRVEELRKSRYMFFNRYYRALIDFIRLSLAFFIEGFHSKGVLPSISDDYGWSRQTDEVILNELDVSSIETISVLVNMISEDSLQRLKKYILDRSHSVSLHFNLIEGKPVSTPYRVKTLVNSTGEFYPLPVFILRLLLRRINYQEIEIELLAQYKKLVMHFSVTHFDSHQHVHLLLPIKHVILSQYTKLERPVIRSSWSISNYLARKPLKFCGLQLLMALQILFFPQLALYRSKTVFQSQDETIVHPGFSYD